MKRITPQQAERLHKVIEECGEVIQIAAKTLDHGWDSFNPDGDRSVTNRRLLEKELGDLRAVVKLAILAGDYDEENIKQNAWEKAKRMGRWTHYQSVSLLTQLAESCAQVLR